MATGLADKLVRISLTGPFKLTTADGADITPRGRKARALILYLWFAPGRSETRRTLMTLLWSDRGPEQARQSLRQTLYELRSLTNRSSSLVAADRFAVRLKDDYLQPMSPDGSPDGPQIIGADLDGLSPLLDRWLLQQRQAGAIPIAGPPAAESTARPVEPIAAPPATSPARARWNWRWYAGAAGSLLLLATTTAGLVGSHAARNRQRIIVVRPLEADRGDAPAVGVSQDLVSDLSRAVLGHDAVLAFADAQPAQRQSTDFRVGGKVASTGKDLHAIVTLSEGGDPAILWSHDYAAPLDDVASLRQQVSTNLAAVLVCALGTRGVPDQIDATAIALYLEACNLHSGDQRQASYLLRQVTARAPSFAGGWADLAISLAFASDDAGEEEAASMRREASAAAQRALALDPHQGNAFYARALLLPGIGNWVARERIIRAGLQAEPDNPQLYNRLAIDLAAVGRVQDSIAANRRAVALDPLFPGKTARLVRALANAGDLDEADEAVRHMRETWPDNPYTWHAQFETAARIGDAREAEALLDGSPEPRFSAREASSWRTFLQARAAPSRRNADAAIAALLNQRREGSVSDPQLVSDFTLLGHPDLALDVALRMPPQSESDFWFRSFLKPLRSDPRFMIVAERQGLLAVWRATNTWPDFCSEPSLPYICQKAIRTHLAATQIKAR